eukprot:TRINITY_DN896_c0_g1_i1.p1 TRINITY_DN896_c0_g1~~TRINITY_DN896_c0_g1_i1.p1  ORF type:complete len:277 (-),score=27.00 TRINITY_DN896_c0_g1_i1:46-876(-)
MSSNQPLPEEFVLKNPTIKMTCRDGVVFHVKFNLLTRAEFYRELFASDTGFKIHITGGSFELMTDRTSKYFGWILDLLAYRKPEILPIYTMSSVEREKLISDVEAFGVPIPLREWFEELIVPPRSRPFQGCNMFNCISEDDIKDHSEFKWKFCLRCGAIWPVKDWKDDNSYAFGIPKCSCLDSDFNKLYLSKIGDLKLKSCALQLLYYEKPSLLPLPTCSCGCNCKSGGICTCGDNCTCGCKCNCCNGQNMCNCGCKCCNYPFNRFTTQFPAESNV